MPIKISHAETLLTRISQINTNCFFFLAGPCCGAAKFRWPLPPLHRVRLKAFYAVMPKRNSTLVQFGRTLPASDWLLHGQIPLAAKG